MLFDCLIDLFCRPYSQLIAVGVFKLKSFATGKAKDIFDNDTPGLDDFVTRSDQIIRVKND